MGLPVVEEKPHEGGPHDEERELVARNLSQVRRKIGIHSGKGGVGKTFLAVNVAFALAASGKRIGLLDADVDCPNVARFLNLGDIVLSGTPEGRITPLEHRGLSIVSTHFLTDDPSLPMIVRGPIKHKVLAEMLSNVEWGKLDALVVDLPPGTADVPMSGMMIGNMDGIIVVTTPQKEAIMDARKSAIMAKDLGVSVLGVVENMSGEAFGEGTGEALAGELGVPFLGTIPLDRGIREMNEAGRIALVEDPRWRVLAEPILQAAMGESVEMRKRTFWQRIMAR